MAQSQQTPETALHFSDYWRVVRNRWPIIVTIVVIVTTTAYFYTKSLDKIYAASAVVQVERDNPDISVFAVSGEGFDPIFFTTEFELIQSQKILYPVIEKMKLQEVFSGWLNAPADALTRDRVFNLLRRSYLKVQPYKNTKLIEIQGNCPDAKMAAELANTVAAEYEEYRVREIRNKSQSGIDALQTEVDNQRAKVETAKAKVEKLRRDLNIDEFNVGTSQGVITYQDMMLQQKEGQLAQARDMALTSRTRLEKVRTLSIEDLENVLTAIQYQDSTIQGLKGNYLSTLSLLESLKKEGLMDEHPRMKATQALIRTYREQLDRLIEGIKGAFEIELAVAETRVASLQGEATALKDELRLSKGDQLAPYQSAKRELEVEENLLQVIMGRFTQLQVESQIGIRPVKLVNRAEPNFAPIRPNVTLNLAIAGVLGLVFGVSLAFFLEYMDTSVKSLDDVERYLQSSVVGVVPEGVNTLNLEGPDSPNAEAYRILRAKIDLQAREGGATTLTVVSGGPGEGKTTTLFNLGYICAYSGINTLLIDTDFRRHSINGILGVDNQGGLADFLLGYAPLHELIRNTEVPNLQIITAGKLPPQCMGALSPAKMSEIVETLKPHYDVILFDSPPILGISDAAVIVHEVDMTLLVIQHRRYPRNISWRAKKVVEEVQGKLSGVVLNKVHLRSDESYYYYTSYYGYYGYYKSGSRTETTKKVKENKKVLDKKKQDINERQAARRGGDAY
jgi:polysaccharide biosynthesis transport protein